MFIYRVVVDQYKKMKKKKKKERMRGVIPIWNYGWDDISVSAESKIILICLISVWQIIICLLLLFKIII